MSPFGKRNFVDHTLTDTSSLIRFIEDNWSLGRIGAGSLDALGGSLVNTFDFHHPRFAPLLLDPETGENDRWQVVTRVEERNPGCGRIVGPVQLCTCRKQ
jgi:hypothetical protein